MLAVLPTPCALVAQSHLPAADCCSSQWSAFTPALPAFAAGGQIDPSAYRVERFSRFTSYTSLSSLGLGEHLSTNVSPYLDVRIFGNYLPVNHSLTRTGVRIAANAEFANVGALADFYPLRMPLRLSAGYLLFNGDRLRVDLQGQPNAVITLNNVDWYSDNADPLHGTARLTLGGNGLLLTAGYGRIVSRSDKHLTFPFEAGVAFIGTPHATIDLSGQVCSSAGTNCQPAATFPGFANALTSQLASWNKDAVPFHIYPIVEGGVAYTFHIRSRTD